MRQLDTEVLQLVRAMVEIVWIKIITSISLGGVYEK